MKRALASLATLTALSCGVPSENPPLSNAARVEGTISSSTGGAAWLFLFHATEGPPGKPSIPAYATAVSRERMTTDARFVFGDVKANVWKLWGLVDTNGNFDPQLDVLAQPGRGDRVGEPVQLNVQPGKLTTTEYSATTFVANEPPAFRIHDAVDELALELSATNGNPITLETIAVDGLDLSHTSFHVGLVDADGNGRPDDANGDGTPDLSLQPLLRWLPKPGQVEEGTDVVVPLAFDPTPFLNTLGGRIGVEVTVTELNCYSLPQAQTLSFDERGAQRLRAFGPPPPGSYELILLVSGGQYWKVPNALGARDASQGVRLHYDRAP